MFAPEFVHVYQLPAASSWIFIVEPAAGVESSVKVTESMFCGLVAFKLYLMVETTKPEIAPVPSPAFEAGTVFAAVNAYVTAMSRPASARAPSQVLQRCTIPSFGEVL
jgi:hypothetical protein